MAGRKARIQRSREEWLKEIKAWRASDKTQAEFAEKLDCHPTMISKWNRIFVSEGKLSEGGTTVRSKPRTAKVDSFVELTKTVPSFTLRRGTVELSIPVDTDPGVITNLLEAMEA